MKKPGFIITVDTEGDDLWAKPKNVTTRNTKYIYRFQELCDRCGFKAVYLTNYEMAMNKEFVRLGRELIKNKIGEIGMHMHAWNSPPLKPLTKEEWITQPYLYHYEKPVMKEKAKYLTELLEYNFGVKMFSHRAGRWGFDEAYASILQELDYKVDCSVTPNFSWSKDKGIDYKNYPDTAYFIDINNLREKGLTGILEVPMTVITTKNKFRKDVNEFFDGGKYTSKIINKFLPSAYWLRPNGKNLKTMLKIVEQAIAEKREYIEFMIHSSELMPGGSPTFRTYKQIEKLYQDLEILFSYIHDNFQGMTLREFYENIRSTV